MTASNQPNVTTPATGAPRLDRAIILFFVLAYTIAWGAFGVIALIARGSGVADAQTLLGLAEAYQFEGLALTVPPWFVYLLTRLADFAFSIAGVIMIAATAGRDGLRRLAQRLTHWRFAWVWYALALLPLGLYAAATALAGGFSSATVNGATITNALFSLNAGFFVSLFLRGAMGEELGLRGFVLPRLQQRMSPFRASLIIGLLWGLWHLPVLIGRDPVSIVAFLLLAFGLAMLFTWLFNGSGGSLIPVLLFHAAQNWEEGFELFFPALLNTDWELPSTLALLLLGLVAAVVVYRTGGYRRSAES